MDLGRPFSAADFPEEFLAGSGSVDASAQAIETSRTGLKALVDSAVVSHEKLPMLYVVLDRFVRTLTTSMPAFTSDNIEISIDLVTSRRFSDVMGDVSQPSHLSVVHVPQWDNYAMFIVDAPLTYAVVDALLGGRRYQGEPVKSARSFTSIETGLIKNMLGLVARDLGAAFAPVAQVEFTVDRIESNPTFARIAQPSNVCAVATVTMKMEDQGGTFQIVLPYVTIEPVREVLLQRFMGEKFGRDNIWENHLAREIRRTNVELEAVLGERNLSLGDVLNFAVGQTLSFAVGKNDPIDLRAGGVHLASGTIGRTGKHVAVKVASTQSAKDQ